MTYEEAKKQVAEYQDPMFGTKLLAVHRQPGNDGTEDCMALVRCLFRGADEPVGIDCWYMHSCGYTRWIQLGCIERKLPKAGWQLLQVPQDIIMFSALYPGKDRDVPHCTKHRECGPFFD